MDTLELSANELRLFPKHDFKNIFAYAFGVLNPRSRDVKAKLSYSPITVRLSTFLGSIIFVVCCSKRNFFAGDYTKDDGNKLAFREASHEYNLPDVPRI